MYRTQNNQECFEIPVFCGDFNEALLEISFGFLPATRESSLEKWRSETHMLCGDLDTEFIRLFCLLDSLFWTSRFRNNIFKNTRVKPYLVKRPSVTRGLTGNHTFCRIGKRRICIPQYNYQFTVPIYDVGWLDAHFCSISGGLPLHCTDGPGSSGILSERKKAVGRRICGC